ncbi:putative DNA-binding transcriptional regulator YafY [Streptosporangium album]|uniref:Putative DNA-binding transcriptional regulator YafY n=1 Tax=Streptosporangium album TaxID=47479 RepID=A0A7W7S5U7_9ACTN|nr:WYL domain-containing protein [Streptosporangium album]MBB4944450.1 putative DNA-binding transcriptional regulator YafY [Streptosporangium album]
MPEPLAPLARAVWGDHPVTALYRGAERTLEPYGLVLKAGVWYLATRSAIYRVDRFTEVEIHSDRRFARDHDFDLAAFWGERAAEFARSLLTTCVTVRLSPIGCRRLPRVADPAALDDALASAGEPDGQGWITVSLSVESLDVAYDQLLRFGPEAEVLGPPELRARMAGAAATLHGLYGRD